MAEIFCPGCPIKDLCEQNKPKYDEGMENGLFGQVIQGLTGEMAEAVRGTKAGLTDERIEEIRQEDVESWGAGSEEEDYLNANPELAKAVHDCEVKIQMGGCAVRSAQTVNS